MNLWISGEIMLDVSGSYRECRKKIERVANDFMGQETTLKKAIASLKSPRRLQKMDYAHSQLESCAQSFYDCVWRTINGLSLSWQLHRNFYSLAAMWQCK